MAKDFKILALDLSDIRTDILGNVVVHCSDYNDLENALLKYNSSTKIIACRSNKLIGLDRLLFGYDIDTLYVLSEKDDKDKEWLRSLILANIIEVQNTQQLMRHLCTKTMICYRSQAMEYKNKSNNGMANLCFLDARKALDYSISFI